MLSPDRVNSEPYILDELVNDPAGSVRGSVGHQRVQFAISVLAEAMHGKAVRQNRRAAKLGQWKCLD